MRTGTGAIILDVFWYDEERCTVGLLVQEGHGGKVLGVWAGEWQLEDLPRQHHDDIKASAQVTIRGCTRIERAAHA